jgi:hypothetical protein
MQRVVRAFPILPGKEAAVRRFAAEMGAARLADATTIHQRLGVAHESWHLQQTPSGLIVIVITEFAGQPATAAARQYAESTETFDTWFKQQVRDLSGIDPSTEPLGPQTTCIYNWPRQGADD